MLSSVARKISCLWLLLLLFSSFNDFMNVKVSSAPIPSRRVVTFIAMGMPMVRSMLRLRHKDTHADERGPLSKT